MVTAFERSTRVRIPKNDAKTYHDFVTRDPAFEASDKSLAVVVHRKGQPEDAMDVDRIAEPKGLATPDAETAAEKA